VSKGQLRKGTSGMPEPFRFDAGWHFDDPIVRFDSFVPEPSPPHVMSSDNRISASMTAQDLTDIQAALQTIRTKLPFLISISNEERRIIPKLGDKSGGFHEKCMAYMNSNPEFLPGFISMAEINKDKALRDQLLQFWPNCETLCESISDTMMVLGSELFQADLAYYQTTREAARRGRAGADTIFNDLRTRFPGSSPEPVEPPPTP
jgi:hypothetical protein